MCGRFTLTKIDGHGIAQRFDVGGRDPYPEEATLGRFNVCPTEPIAVATAGEDGERVAQTVRWGLVPPWARELGKGFQPINGRAETAADKRPFAPLMERADRRCLVLADGWYEWLRSENPKQPRVPFRYTVDGGEPFAFAGLYGWTKIGDDFLASATILTTRANEVCAPVHDRMPVVLAGPEEEAAWLAGADEPELVAPLAAARTSARPANPAVNRAGVEGPELIEPPSPEPEAQQSLL